MGTDCGTSARTAAVASGGGLAQKRALDSPERREAVWGLPDCEDSPATLRSRLRGTWDQGSVCAIGDRTRVRRTARPSLCELLRAGREPTKHPLSAGRQRSDAVLHGSIVQTA